MKWKNKVGIYSFIHVILVVLLFSYSLALKESAEYGVTMFPFLRKQLALGYTPSFWSRNTDDWFYFEKGMGLERPADGSIQCYYYNSKTDFLLVETQTDDLNKKYYLLKEKKYGADFEEVSAESIDTSDSIRVQIAGNFRLMLFLSDNVQWNGFFFFLFLLLEIVLSLYRVIDHFSTTR